MRYTSYRTNATYLEDKGSMVALYGGFMMVVWCLSFSL